MQVEVEVMTRVVSAPEKIKYAAQLDIDQQLLVRLNKLVRGRTHLGICDNFSTTYPLEVESNLRRRVH